MTSSAALVAREKICSVEGIREIALNHPCASHQFFSYLSTNSLNIDQIAALLRNYDAHASVLRRLLLKAATIMPESAVGYILENVRNEYGNGRPEQAHQLQLLDLARQAGVESGAFNAKPIQKGVAEFIKEATKYYFPRLKFGPGLSRAAIAAGAITATEILALEEFKALQVPFKQFGLENHIWFDHINVEAEHTDESIQLALYFSENEKTAAAVEYGFNGVLNANVMLYDGLLNALIENQS